MAKGPRTEDGLCAFCMNPKRHKPDCAVHKMDGNGVVTTIITDSPAHTPTIIYKAAGPRVDGLCAFCSSPKAHRRECPVRLGTYKEGDPVVAMALPIAPITPGVAAPEEDEDIKEDEDEDDIDDEDDDDEDDDDEGTNEIAIPSAPPRNDNFDGLWSATATDDVKDFDIAQFKGQYVIYNHKNGELLGKGRRPVDAIKDAAGKISSNSFMTFQQVP